MASQVDTSTGHAPQVSALQALFEQERTSQSPHQAHLRQLAQQVAHNLEFQHLWSDIQIHNYSPSGSPSGDHDAPSPQDNLAREPKLFPRPLISGLPPQRLYIHPDEQIALLQAQKAVGGTGMGEVLPEREWVCPSHLREKWSLRRFGEVFDHITLYPPELDEDEKDPSRPRGRHIGVNDKHHHVTTGGEHSDSTQSDFNKWRTTKRILLATLDDDSTVVYYIVHDGIVKPRQN
ncbi:hypothetical protein MBLNU459_g3582t1 [Dothideomycetes sp. NU459]